MDNFSKRITRRRLELKLTQKQVAAKLGVPLSTYKEWEYGRKIQGETVFLKLSEVLEMDLYTLMSGKISLGNDELPKVLSDLIDHLEKVRKCLVSSFKYERSAFDR